MVLTVATVATAATAVTAAADEEPMESGRGVLPPQIFGGNRSSKISSMFFVKNT
jgi:hypothetical protein